MPAPLDLTGLTFGRLTVLRRAGRMKFGRVQAAWLCRCGCGAELRVPQDRLPRRASTPKSHIIDACRNCRAPVCEVCGKPVTRNLQRKTCSQRCARKRQRKRQLDYWHHRYSTDPEYRERKLAVHKRARRDPERREHVLAEDRKRQRRKAERLSIDPAYREHVRALQAATYRRLHDRIWAKRRARLDAMTSHQRAAWCERMREYGRDWRRKWRADIAKDPERVEKYRATMREYRRQRALLNLVSTANKLLNRRGT